MMEETHDPINETEPLVSSGDRSIASSGVPRQLSYGSRNESFVVPNYRTYIDLLREGTSTDYPPVDNPVTVALKRCNERVLKPYRRLLLFVGWEPWFEDPMKWWQTAVNIISPLIVMLFVLMGYVIQYAACFRRDSAGNMEPWVINNHTNHSTYMGCHEVIISQYVIPDMLHSLAYLYSFYLLRFAQSEQLPTLVERVFLQTSPTQSGFLSQGRLIRVMGAHLAMCVVWVLLSLAAQLIHVVAIYNELYFSFLDVGTQFSNLMLIMLMLLSFLFLDIVYTAVVINFCVQCCLLTFYIEGLQTKIKQKLIDLTRAMKEIGEIETQLRSLNYTTGVALSIVLFNFGTMAFLGATYLFRPNKHYDNLMLASTSLSVIFWVSIMALPIVQAARLSAACNSLRKVGHAIRQKPFVYQDTPDAELDTFMLYTSTLNLRAKIFLVPVKTSYLAGFVVTFLFLFLLLFQTHVLYVWL